MKSLGPSKLGQFVCLAVLLQSLGCASLTDWRYEQKQRGRARAAFECYGKACNECYPEDYKKGFVDGYYEVVTGGSDCPPLVAPACYWDPDQVLENCDNRRHAYYSGWQDGAAAADRSPDTHYLQVFETCDCPAPRCETPCPESEACSCPSYVGQSDGGQMIEVISDVPIGMTSERAKDQVKQGADATARDLPASTVEAASWDDRTDSYGMFVLTDQLFDLDSITTTKQSKIFSE